MLNIFLGYSLFHRLFKVDGAEPARSTILLQEIMDSFLEQKLACLDRRTECIVAGRWSRQQEQTLAAVGLETH